MSDDENALRTRLARWLRCVRGGSVRWGAVAVGSGSGSGSTRHGVVLELAVDTTMWLEDEDDEFEHLLQLREAIDLVRLTMAVEPEVLAQEYALKPERYMDYDEDDAGLDKSHKEAVAALARGVPAELHLRFVYQSIKTRMLAAQLVTRFTNRTLSTNAGYLAIRSELIGRIQDHEALATPGRITMFVNSTEIEDFNLLEAEDFFFGLAALAEKLVKDESAKSSATWTQSACHSPLVVEEIGLRLHRFCITHRVVQAAQRFVDAGIPVDCKALNLDVRLISCAEDELRTFVTALSRGATKLVISTGIDVNEEDIEPVDMDGQDRREIIEMVLRVIASVEQVHEVNLEGLLTLCTEPLNRDLVLRSVIELFASPRAQSLTRLNLGHSFIYDEEDIVTLEQIASEYRAAHSGVTLRVKQLMLLFANIDSGRDLSRILSVFDDIEEVYVGASLTGRPITPEPHAFLRFPSLRRVRLHRVRLPSMDVFDPSMENPQIPHKPALDLLALDGVEFRDIASVGRFVAKLHPSSGSVLATSLRSLEISPIYGNRLENQVFFEHEGVLALDDVLLANRVLSNLRISIDPADPVVEKEIKRLYEHSGSVLPVPLTERRTAITKARNTAFLSVIRETDGSSESARSALDARVLSLIFEMIAPCELRKIGVDYIEYPDDDDT